MADELEHQSIISSSRKSQLRERGIKRLSLVLWLTGIFLVEIVASGITYPILLQRMQALFSSGQVIGQVQFLSSRDAPPGSFDQVKISIQHIPTSPAGEQYYAWLVNNSENTLPFNWLLPVQNGSLYYLYTDLNHNNLLTNKPLLFLITLETAGTNPVIPSNLPAARLYYTKLPPTIPNQATFDIRPCPEGSISNNICF